MLFLAASLLKGMDSDRLAMCAICSCLCGDRMAPNILFFFGFFLFAPAGHGRCQSPWQSPNYRHGRRPCQTAPQAQPPFDCPTSVSMQDTQKKKQNYTVAKLEAQVCVCPAEMRGLAFFWRARQRGQHIISFRCDSRAFSTSTSSVFLYVPAR